MTSIEGIALVDESAITGESAPVIRESGGDRSAVTGGTRVLSDRIVVQITTQPGESFIDRMIALVEGADRQKTPNEIALQHPARRADARLRARGRDDPAVRDLLEGAAVDHVLVALLVCLIPTTIGALLSAIGIAGMDRLVQRNVLAMSGRAVEAAGDVSTLAARQDRHDHLRQPHGRRSSCRSAASTSTSSPRSVLLSCLADETPEGRSIVDARRGAATASRRVEIPAPSSCPSPRRPGWRASNGEGRSIRKGAADAVQRWVAEQGGPVPHELAADRRTASRQSGGTPLVVAEGDDGARRDPPQGHGQAGHRRAVRRDARAWASAR